MPVAHALENLLPPLRRALAAHDRADCTNEVKRALEHLVRSGDLDLPDRFRQPVASAYARRLLHRCPQTGCTAIVMCWGPGQETALHDHAGLWCVECVLEGEIEVESFQRVAGDSPDRLRFEPTETVRCGVGEAGSLIPPNEYHVLRNPRPDRIAMTLHIYEDEMQYCTLFRQMAGGWYTPERHPLGYDA